jgi:inorganic pyrophosphatase
MTDLLDLPPFGEDGELHMIVERPRGSPVKLKYEPKLEIFTVAGALPLGLTYPFDWGFIAGTEGDDGDPIDALALHDAATFPGVLLPCRPLGVVDVDQKGKNGGREANPRLILMPLWQTDWARWRKQRSCPSGSGRKSNNSS